MHFPPPHAHRPLGRPHPHPHILPPPHPHPVGLRDITRVIMQLLHAHPGPHGACRMYTRAAMRIMAMIQ